MNLLLADCQHLPLAANSVDHIFTDPPYLRQYLPCFDWLAAEGARVVRPGGFVATLVPELYLDRVILSFHKYGRGLRFYFPFRWQIKGQRTGVIWLNRRGQKPINVVLRSKTLLVYGKGNAQARTGMTQAFYGRSEASKAYHHWGQDVQTARYFLECLTHRGQLILDPFAGGGTTAAAAEALSRRWLCADVDPAALVATADHVADRRYPARNLALFTNGASTND